MKIRIGSRTSKLALKQVEIAMKRIGATSFEIIGVDTAGDRRSRENKVQFDKKNFVEDIDSLLVDRKIDIARRLKVKIIDQSSWLKMLK